MAQNQRHGYGGGARLRFDVFDDGHFVLTPFAAPKLVRIRYA
jgi:hypothetical protein